MRIIGSRSTSRSARLGAPGLVAVAVSLLACSPAADASPSARGEAAARSDGSGPERTSQASAARQASPQRHRMPLGFSFAYPEEWTLEPQGHGAMLVPPDTPRDAQGSFAEVILVALEGAPGVESAADPRLGALFDGLVGGAPRTGEEEANSGLGPGRVLTYAGDALGTPVRYRIHVTVHEGTVAYLVHAAREDLAGRHREAAAEIFQSFARGEPTVDPAAAGAWGRSTTDGSSTPGVGAVHTQSSETLVLGRDGRARRSSSSSVSAGAPGVSGLSDGGPETRDGRWGAADGWLTIRWQNGATVSFRYSVFTSSGAPALKLQQAGGEPVYFRPAG